MARIPGSFLKKLRGIVDQGPPAVVGWSGGREAEGSGTSFTIRDPAAFQSILGVQFKSG